MRILYVIDSLSIGGAEMLLIDLVKSGKARGWNVCVAYFTPGPLAETLAGMAVPVIRLSNRGLRDPRALWRAMRLVRNWRPDVVHTHLTKSDLVGQFAARIVGVPRRVVTIHNIDPWRRRAHLSVIYRLAIGKLDACIACSREVGEFTISSRSVPRDTITVIDNGIDTDRFDPAATVPLPLGGYGVPQGATVVAVIGRLQPQKDHSNFLSAANRVAQACPSVHFLIVGQGDLEHDLRTQAQSFGLTPHRLTFTGVIRDMPRLLAAVDIVVISSAWEGLPVILLEAMAMARPVASTSVGGIPGVVHDKENALLVPPGDPNALASVIKQLSDAPDMRSRFGRAARQAMLARKSGNDMISQTFAFYSADMRPT